MAIWMHEMTVGSFPPMLHNLSNLLDKGAEFAKGKNLDLFNARLAPDMFTLAQQVQEACKYPVACVARLTGKDAPTPANNEKTLEELKASIAASIAYVNGAKASDFEGAEARDCSMPLPPPEQLPKPTQDMMRQQNGGKLPKSMRIEMNGLQFLRDWSLPHFYFHVTTAYDILRNQGVQIGKIDYLAQIGAMIRSEN